MAVMAASRKTEKYSSFSSTYMFEPIAVENLGMLGRQISSQTGDVRESSYLFQRISEAIQRFNSVLLHDSLTDDIPHS